MKKLVFVVFAAVVLAGCVGQPVSPTGAAIVQTDNQPLKLTVAFEDQSNVGASDCRILAKYSVRNAGSDDVQGVSVRLAAKNSASGQFEYANIMGMGDLKAGASTATFEEYMPYRCDNPSLVATATASDSIGHSDSLSWQK